MKTSLLTTINSAMFAMLSYSTTCLLLVLPVGCADINDAGELDEDVSITVASQALGTVPPDADPQACALPEGRYVVFATPTTRTNVYNVLFPNDAVPNSKPSNLCKTMEFVWNEGAVPVPASPPPDNQFYMMLFEGWMIPTVGSRRFAVKAVWQTHDGKGVVTAVSNTRVFGYAIVTCDLGAPCNERFNWIGPGFNVNHSFTMPMDSGLPEQFTNRYNLTIALTGPTAPGDFLRPVEFLYLKSGSSRIFGQGVLATRPCTTGNACPQP